MKITKFLAITAAALLTNSLLFAEVSFSGFAGGKLDLNSSSSEKFEPALNFQSFFSGQFALSENVISHVEFSLSTEDMIDNSIFKSTPGTFKVDELSLIIRKQFPEATNYLSAFAGTYEPIGSDIFLRRQFGIQPIASRITENWLGLSGSVIYPTFGIGGSDVVRFNAQPVALGVYVYVNHELDDCYVLNTDARFAAVYRFFTFDVDAGIGMPLKENSSDEALIVVDTLYWRAGANMLIGNSYTTSLFMQAGISEVPFKKNDHKVELDAKNAYLLFEPRFKTKKFQLNITVFSLPQETADGFRFINDTKTNPKDESSLLFIHDTLGVNLDIFTDSLYISNKAFEFGINGALTFPDKNLKDVIDNADKIMDEYNITVSPYLATKAYNGIIHFMVQARITDFIDEEFGSALTFNLGYKTQF